MEKAAAGNLCVAIMSHPRIHALFLATTVSVALVTVARGGSNKDGSGIRSLLGYTHDTGAARLTVDEAWLASYHYHSLYYTAADDSDNLWRGFLGAHFDQTDSTVINGFPGDSGWGAVNDFDTLHAPLVVDAVQGYNHTSLAYGSLSCPGILVVEDAYSGISDEHWIVVQYTVANLDSAPLTGGRLIYFYEGDLPVFDYDDDNSAWDSATSTVWEYDYGGGNQIASGIAWLGEGGTLRHGDYDDWYTSARSESVLLEIVVNPSWTGYLNRDVGVYLICEIPSLERGDWVRFPIAFVNGPDDSTCLAAAREAKNAYDSLFVGLEELANVRWPIADVELLHSYPNPFAFSTTITYHLTRGHGDAETRRGGHLSTYQPINLSIYDLSGRLIRTLIDTRSPYLAIQPSNRVVWDGRDELGRYVGSGTYFCRLKAGSHSTARKLTILR